MPILTMCFRMAIGNRLLSSRGNRLAQMFKKKVRLSLNRDVVRPFSYSVINRLFLSFIYTFLSDRVYVQ